jgi:hypothetical protein
VDHINECLVTHDFDWTPERALIDDWFCELYSQLAYETHCVAILDCCHSDGMTRNGLPKARGLSPADDVRHRLLRWDADREMWGHARWGWRRKNCSSSPPISLLT